MLVCWATVSALHSCQRLYFVCACVVPECMYCVCACNIQIHRMGDIIEERGELQRKVELLESQLKQLHSEYTTLQHTSVTSSQKSTNKQPPSFLNSKLGSASSSNTLNVKTPKVHFLSMS